VSLKFVKLSKVICNSIFCNFTVPSSPPVDIEPESLNSRTLHISWSPPPTEDRNGPIIGYLLDITDARSGLEFPLINTTEPLHTQFSLTPFKIYHISVAASTEAGTGPFSDAISVTMPQDGNSSYIVYPLSIATYK